MPTTYAHYRFGREVTRLLPASIQDEILQNQSLFQIGLHGPDILFYYKALSHNPISSYENQMHHKPGRAFFESQLKSITASDLSFGCIFLSIWFCDSLHSGYLLPPLRR